MKKILFLTILLIGNLISKEICDLYYTENYDFKNNIYDEGMKSLNKTITVYCDNPIIEKIKKEGFFTEKTSEKTSIIHGKYIHTTYYRTYFKYIKNLKQNKNRKKNKFDKTFNFTCKGLYKIIYSKPQYPEKYFQINFTCKNEKEGLKKLKKQGIKKYIVWKERKKYIIYIKPEKVKLIKFNIK